MNHIFCFFNISPSHFHSLLLTFDWYGDQVAQRSGDQLADRSPAHKLHG